MAVVAAAGLVVSNESAAAGATATYTSTITIPVAPAAQYTGSGGGDGWSLAFSSTQVFNVFHHQSVLQFACHEQADASECYSPETITDTSGANFGSSAHPDMYFDNASGKLYVYATRADATAGVVCIDTTQAATNTNPFCGFTALTAVGDGYYPGMSNISNPQLVGSRWYAFNYYPGAAQTGARNKVLCFDVTTDAACTGQPFALTIGTGVTDADGYFPSPTIANMNGKLLVPLQVTDSSNNTSNELACFDTATKADCAGAYPVPLTVQYSGNYGAPYPLLDSSGALQGYCLPTGTDQCFTLAGASATTPANMPSVITASDGWNGPAVVIGTRIYVPNGNSNNVQCFDYSKSGGGNSCTNFPFNPQNLGYLYTVVADPQRPACLWVNADNGSGQIQNFDAFSGQPGCGSGSIRVLASQFVVNQSTCAPVSYDSIQVNAPPRSQYQSGQVSFEDGNGNPISGANPIALDNTGSANLTGLGLNTASGLPQFLFDLTGVTGNVGQVTATLTYEQTYDPACVQPGTTVQKTATSTTTTLSGGGKSGASISVPAGTAVTDQAALAGNNAGAASGSVTYSVYSDANCTNLVGPAATKSISTPGSVPASSPVTIATPGTYYWVVAYSGDAGNNASTSRCGAEVETVTQSGPPPSGCSVISATNTSFSSTRIENILNSDTTKTERLVLRSLSGEQKYFVLGAVTSATCVTNPAFPLASGHQYNGISVNATGSYGKNVRSVQAGYTIHIEILITGPGTARVSFTLTKTGSQAVVWSVAAAQGTVTSGGETETG